MCTHKSDIYHTSNKDDYSDNPIVISSYVENIASILNIVCRWKLCFQFLMTMPCGAFYLINPIVHWSR